MNRKPVHAAILHSGPWKNLFGDFPSYLSRVTGLPLVETPEGLDMAYVMGWPEHSPLPCESFIPLEAVYLAHDKRKQAAFFSTNGITTPETHIIFSEADALAFHRNRPDREWLLKWPTGCGGTGHQVLDDNTRITPFWKPPFLVQELIRMEVPRVYRLFAAGGETFNWCVRESTAKTGSSPFISYGTGASVRLEKDVPEAARIEAERALRAAGLWDSFGAVDLIRSDGGVWHVLELNTDGVYNYVERIVPVPDFTRNLDRHTCRAIRLRLDSMRQK